MYNTPGETTYFEFAYLLSLPEPPQAAEQVSPWKFSMTANQELRAAFEERAQNDASFNCCFRLRVVLIHRPEIGADWCEMV